MLNRFLKGGIILVTLALVGAGCSNLYKDRSVSDAGSKPKVAATIFPIYDLVREVGGEDVDVKLIVSPGASPHYFEPTVEELRDLQNTSLIFMIGEGLDNWSENILDNIEGSDKVVLSDGVRLRESADEHEEEGHHGEHDDHDEDEHEEEEDHNYEHGHGPIDPHYWLSPENALIMIDTIEKELSELAPQYSDNFEKRSKSIKKKITEKSVEWKAQTRNLKDREFVTFHDSFYYFAQYFGLDVVATFEPFPGKEPTIKYLQELQVEIDEHGIANLFTEPQLSSGSIEAFAKDNGIELGVLDPVGGEEGRNSYIELIDFNVQQVVQSLQ